MSNEQGPDTAVPTQPPATAPIRDTNVVEPENALPEVRAEDLPENCKKYVEYIEKKLNCDISMISVGPERSQNIYRYNLGEFVK